MDPSKPILLQCGECQKPVRSTSKACIKCNRCQNIFHPTCVNILDKKTVDETVWVCPLCRCNEPKTGNLNTPIRSSVPTRVATESTETTLTVDLNPHTAPRSGKLSPLSSPFAFDKADSENIINLIDEIKLLRGDISEIKSNLASLSDLVKDCFTRLDDHENKISDINLRLRKVEERERDRENELLISRNMISELQQELDSREQASLRNEAEVFGVNEFPDENPKKLIEIISEKIEASIDCADIDFVTRIGRRNRETPDQSDGEPSTSQPRPLVVRFLRRQTCEAFLAAHKSKRNLTSADIGIAGTSRTLYINERLTQRKRLLFRSARRQAKTAKFDFCWVKGGNVYIRKAEGSPAIAIKTKEDIEHHLGQPPALTADL